MTADVLMSRHTSAWQAATVHPFLAGVRDGSLPEHSFDRWLAQDYLFAQALVRAQSRIAATAPLADVGLLAGGVVATVAELGWFKEMAAGRGLARAVGPAADYLAAAAVVGVGIWMLTRRAEDEETASRIAGVSGLALVALGLSISMDEFAIGFSLGLVKLPIVPVIAAIAVLAFAVSQLGLALGSLVSARLRGHAEQAAGVALIALGVYLIVIAS